MTSYIVCVVARPFGTKYLNDVASLFSGVTFTSNTPKLLRGMTCEWCFTSKKTHFTLDFNKADDKWILMVRIPAIFDVNRINEDGIKDSIVDLLQSWGYDCRNPFDIQEEEEDEQLVVEETEPFFLRDEQEPSKEDDKEPSKEDDKEPSKEDEKLDEFDEEE